MTRIQYSALEPLNMPCSIWWRSASATTRNSSAKPTWISGRNPQRVAMQAPGPAVGDRAREQLLDRPVDHRQDHEHDRPAQRDPAVGGLVEDVAGGGQVGEGEDPGRGDPDRQHPRARRRRSRALRSRRSCSRGAAPSSGAARGRFGPRRAISRPHQHHRPRKRRARPRSPRRAREQAHEAAPGPVVDVPGRVAEVAHVGARARFSTRHSGSRGTETSRCRAPRAPSRPAARSGSGRARAPRSP